MQILWTEEAGNDIEVMSKRAIAESLLTRFVLPGGVRARASEGGRRMPGEGKVGTRETCREGGERQDAQ